MRRAIVIAVTGGAAAVVVACGGSISTGTADGGNHEPDGGAADAVAIEDTGGGPVLDATFDAVFIDTGTPEAAVEAGVDAGCDDDGGITQPAPVPLPSGTMCLQGNEALATWSLTGATPSLYQTGFDTSMTCSGNPSLHLASSTATGSDFGAMAGVKGPGGYAGHRVRLSAWVLSSNVTGWAGLWMRVDSAQMNGVAFDNMQCRALTGTTGWQQVQVVLDVASDATEIVYGVLLSDQGEVWVDGASFDVVDPGAGGACFPVTGCP